MSGKHPRKTIGTRDNWRDVHVALKREAHKYIGTLPEVEQAYLLNELRIEVTHLLEAFAVRARNATKIETVLVDPKARRRAVLGACRLLGIDPPRDGRPVDHGLIRRRKVFTMRATHPDMTGTDASRPQFEAVVAAVDTLESYNLDCGKRVHPDLPPASPAPFFGDMTPAEERAAEREVEEGPSAITPPEAEGTGT